MSLCYMYSYLACIYVQKIGGIIGATCRGGDRPKKRFQAPKTKEKVCKFVDALRKVGSEPRDLNGRKLCQSVAKQFYDYERLRNKTFSHNSGKKVMHFYKANEAAIKSYFTPI